MSSVLGFLLINLYAFLLIMATSIMFFSKQRLKEFEDETYKKFLISNIAISLSGLILGIAVSPGVNINTVIIGVLNKLYLIALLMWISTLTLYFTHVSFKEKLNVNRVKKVFKAINIISIILIIILPIEVNVTDSGAVALGPSVLFTYAMFALGFITQIVCLLSNFKNLKNKKYIPLYLLILFGILVLVIMIVNPSLNYVINPAFIFIAFIMYHTIENPDMQMIDTLLRNKELVEQTVTDKSNFLFKVSQEIKKPVKSIIENVKKCENITDQDTKKAIMEEVLQDANNAYFIVNDITDLSSADFKKFKIQDAPYITKKLMLDIKTSALNKLKNSGKEDKIKMNLEALNNYPEKLQGDNIKIKQIILSILDNSIKYTDEGFIDGEVECVTRYDVCRLIFTIRDSGKGISISKINELLSVNEEIDIAEFDKIDSLELELPVVIRMIKALGGSISIRSENDKGTIFVVVIDQKIVASNEEKAIQSARRYSSSVKASKRVLIADDTENLEKLGRLFSKYNVDVVLTFAGSDVIDKINSGDKYDLIVLKDEMKPDSGFDVLKKLKKEKKFNTPVVITIKDDKEFIKDHFIEDGFADCLLESKQEDEVKRICEKYI